MDLQTREMCESVLVVPRVVEVVELFPLLLETESHAVAMCVSSAVLEPLRTPTAVLCHYAVALVVTWEAVDQ